MGCRGKKIAREEKGSCDNFLLVRIDDFVTQ